MPSPLESSDGAPPPDAGATTDAASRDWLARLAPGARERDAAIAELHGLLLKAARFTLAKRAVAVQDRRERLDDLAMEAADDALLAVLAHLRDFRGESRFTTWAWKFAIVQTAVAMRRREWAKRELPAEDDDVWATADGSLLDELEQRDVLAALKRGVETELTPHQRKVFVAIALNEVPIDVLAERLSTTRGALYKTLHDARHRLRAYVTALCLGPERWRKAHAEHAT
jgi:RNA polymerase sigma-70 factor (ECF subfamily)